MNKATPQDDKKVSGYRQLSDHDIALMNQLKEQSAAFLQTLAHIQNEVLPLDKEATATSEAYRSVALAKTKMQEACMWGCRAVARPDSSC